MPIYEYYCPDNNRIYQFFARTLAQGRTVPPCPDNPKYRMRKVLSRFAVGGAGQSPGGAQEAPSGGGPEDARMEAAMGAMEREMAGVDESDPRAMGRMIRRMAEISGEKIDGDMEEVVRKLEEGADPDSLDSEFGADLRDENVEGPAADAPTSRSPRRPRRVAPTLDPRLHDFP
jgi:hypothetical protein